MTPDRWKRIDELLDAVLELPEKERENFLSENCIGEEEIKTEVLSILKAQTDNEDFLETSAMKIAARNLAAEKTIKYENSFLGRTIETYKIEKPIGAGGMGEVYMAHDQKLNRKVALKILPPEYSSSGERLKRFQLESRAISILNHPNIITIYDVGSFDGVNFIATEFVNGKTFRDLINQRPKIIETLEYMIQVCSAISAAHYAGIIHRDIKPENIMIRPDGYVKILDFGLAKLTEISPHTLQNLNKTAEGIIIGTPAYMSPEQASGSIIDHRTDFWSLGVVLYEMLTGKNPFKRESRQATIQAILRDDPPLPSSLNSQISTELDTVLKKALEKDPDLSYQTASDLLADLKRIKSRFDSGTTTTNSSDSSVFQTASSRFSGIFAGLAALLVLSVLVGISVWYFFLSEENESNGFEWTKAKTVQLTNKEGTEYFPNLSPDGDSFVYTAKNSNDSQDYDIFLRRVEGKTSINLTENFPENDTQPVFSPDGKFIAFRSGRNGGGIYVMEETGENPRRVSDFGFHPSWSPDGKYLVISEKGVTRPTVRTESSLWIINVENEEKKELIGNFVYQPAWSPNGKRIAFWSIGSDISKRDVATISVEGGEPEIITSSASANWNPVWSPDGKYLYFASNRKGNMAIWRIQIDENTGKTTGEPEIVPTPAKFNSHISFSKDGNRLIYVQMNIQSNLKAVDFDPDSAVTTGEPYWVTSGDQEVLRPRLSPDGRKFVINIARQTQDDIVVVDRNGENWRDLTNDKFFDRYPVWTTNGNEIAFYSDRSGSHQIWLMNSDGSNLRQLTDEDRPVGFPVVSPVKKQISFRVEDKFDHYVIDYSDSNNKIERILPNPNKVIYASWDWSPDGKKLAGRWVDSEGNLGIGYYSLETNQYKKVWTGLSTLPRWFPDSKRVIVSYKNKVHILDTVSGEISEISTLIENNIAGVGISRDGRLLYFVVETNESNIWLLDLRQN